MSRRKLIFILLTLISGFLILSPFLNYDDIIAQGDHGRDFYCFNATLKGELPYRDYWWVYGPLMPYYYASFLKIFGITIKSVLWGYFALYVTCGLLIFLILAPIIPLSFAYIASLWFWAFGMDFFFTYNHIGGIALLLTTTWSLSQYLREPRKSSLYWGTLSILLLCFVKINFGISALIVFTSMVFIKDKLPQTNGVSTKKLFYWSILGILPLSVLIIYLLLLKGLPLYAIRQCLPYLASDHPHHAEPLSMITRWWTSIALTINRSWPNRLFFVWLMTSIIQTVLIIRKDGKNILKHPISLTVLALLFFYILNLHEFLLSGALYRTFWSQAFSILLIFLFIGFAAKQFRRPIRWLLSLILILIISLNYISIYQSIHKKKNATHYLDLEHAQVFLGNHPIWTQTVKQTTEYLQSNLEKDELFLALPYDPLYYFLADKPSPTRQLIFFEHINIPPEQEETIIGELEQKKVNWVVLSSRFFSPQAGMGILGKTYCPLIGNYLKQHFEVKETIGDWKNQPEWVYGHGVRILKRIPQKK